MSAIDELLDQDNWYWSNDVNSVAVFGLDKDAYLPKASEELASLKSELERMRAVVDAARTRIGIARAAEDKERDALARRLLVGMEV